MRKTKELTFEDRIKRLEEIQEKMDSSDLSLDENTKLFEESAIHIKFCREELNKAELKVKMVVDQKEVDFN